MSYGLAAFFSTRSVGPTHAHTQVRLRLALFSIAMQHLKHICRAIFNDRKRLTGSNQVNRTAGEIASDTTVRTTLSAESLQDEGTRRYSRSLTVPRIDPPACAIADGAGVSLLSLANRDPAPPRVDASVLLGRDVPASMLRPTWRLSDYIIVKRLGASDICTVYRAMCRHSGQRVVLKVFGTELNDYRRVQVSREVRLHARLQHPNIIRLYASFQDAQRVVMVMECIHGTDLERYMHKHNTARMSEALLARVVLPQLLSALEYMHSMSVCHRDIKKENVIMNRLGQVKLCDFGMSIDLSEENAVTRCGTAALMAPEVRACPLKVHATDNKDNVQLAYNCKADVWSVGVMCYGLLLGVLPLEEIDARLVYPNWFSGEAVDFMRACLHTSSSLRPAVHQLQGAKWLCAHVNGQLPPGTPAPRAAPAP